MARRVPETLRFCVFFWCPGWTRSLPEEPGDVSGNFGPITVGTTLGRKLSLLSLKLSRLPQALLGPRPPAGARFHRTDIFRPSLHIFRPPLIILRPPLLIIRRSALIILRPSFFILRPPLDIRDGPLDFGSPSAGLRRLSMSSLRAPLDKIRPTLDISRTHLDISRTYILIILRPPLRRAVPNRRAPRLGHFSKRAFDV
ncbi:hypothetical protein T484DRAFT_1743250 [Baffinella frigidus]|nr:hypothetical protein T484DRAFT_1743250 [Cryptophyta sp. CCMP2293]